MRAQRPASSRSSPGRDPRRRNRNDGTARRGHGQDNRQGIPQPHGHGDRSFFHVLKDPVRCSRTIRERTIGFFVEPPTRDCCYACTVEDVARLLSDVPLDDWAGISAVVFRQPTRKQDLLRPVWGRLVFDTQESGITGSAIQLDAQDPRQEIRWSPSLGPDHQKELSALVADGHRVLRSCRWWSIRPTLDSIRATQLYRTLLHEIGHHVDWCRATPKLYFRRPLDERERSAHRYAMTLRMELERRATVPFERIRNDAAKRDDGLDPRWFG